MIPADTFIQFFSAAIAVGATVAVFAQITRAGVK